MNERCTQSKSVAYGGDVTADPIFSHICHYRALGSGFSAGVTQAHSTLYIPRLQENRPPGQTRSNLTLLRWPDTRTTADGRQPARLPRALSATLRLLFFFNAQRCRYESFLQQTYGVLLAQADQSFCRIIVFCFVFNLQHPFKLVLFSPFKPIGFQRDGF